jgi:hypothetical protein
VDSAEKTRLLEELQIAGDNTNGDNLTYAKTTDVVLLANIKAKVIDNIPRYKAAWKSLMMLKSINQIDDLTLEIVKNAILATYRSEVKGKVVEQIPVQAIQGKNSCAHCGATDHKEWSPWCIIDTRDSPFGVNSISAFFSIFTSAVRCLCLLVLLEDSN